MKLTEWLMHCQEKSKIIIRLNRFIGPHVYIQILRTGLDLIDGLVSWCSLSQARQLTNFDKKEVNNFLILKYSPFKLSNYSARSNLHIFSHHYFAWERLLCLWNSHWLRWCRRQSRLKQKQWEWELWCLMIRVMTAMIILMTAAQGWPSADKLSLEASCK